jgi:uncharacterized protein YdiU (UPF0061 family)
MMLAQALIPLVSNAQDLGRGLEVYRATFARTYHEMMLKKLGLTDLDAEADGALIDELHAALEGSEIDMTLFYRGLSQLVTALLLESQGQAALFRELIGKSSYAAPDNPAHESLEIWLSRYVQRLRRESASAQSIRETMLGANPKYVLRNYLAQGAIEAATAGDLSVLNRLLEVLKTPYAEHPEHEDLAAKRPEWARTKAGCATLSCSS